MTSNPRGSSLRSSPPVASLARSLRDVADSSAPHELIVLVTIASMPSSACTVSVFALPLPEMSSSHSGSPSMRSTAAAASTASRASVS